MATKEKTNPYLKISMFETSPRLARRLSPALAWRCRAVPIAEARDRVTVAMANPEDMQAQELIMNALSSSICVVQADVQVIDHALMDLWPELSPQCLKVLSWLPDRDPDADVEFFARAVVQRLNAHLETFQTSERGKRALQALTLEVEHGRYGLLIINRQDQSLLQRIFAGQPACKLMDQTKASLLIVHQPRWPIKKILLIIRDGGIEDQAAIDWTVHIAKSSSTTVSILPIIPPAPHMYDGAQAMRYSLPALLSTDTPLGRELRHLARRLVDWEIEGTLRLRDDPPDWQICNEVSEEDPDLIIIAAEPHNRLIRWLKGEMVNPLMCWADRPVLIAKPIVTNEEKEY